MDSLMQSDIFFFVTTIVVVLLGLLVAAVFVSIILILRHVRAIARKVEKEASEIVDDVHAVRTVAKKFLKSKKNQE
jgi:ABC-type sulfate transport system permease component